MNLEQRLRESLVAPDPGAVFTARVMARMARGRARRGRRFIVIGALLVAGVAAAMLTWQMSEPRPTLQPIEATAIPTISEPAPVVAEQVVQVAQVVEESQAAPTVPELPLAASPHFSVIVMPLRQEAQDAAGRGQVEAFYATLVEELRNVPGVTLLAPGGSADHVLTITALAGRTSSSVGITVRSDGGPGLVLNNRLSGVDVDYDNDRLTGRTRRVETSSYEAGGSGGPGSVVWIEMRVEPRGESQFRYTFPIGVEGSSVQSQCAGPDAGLKAECLTPARLAARQIEKLRMQVFPPDPALQLRIVARLAEPGLTQAQQLQVLQDLLTLNNLPVELTQGRSTRLDAATLRALTGHMARLPAHVRAQVWSMLRGVSQPELIAPLVDSLRHDTDRQVRLEALATLTTSYATDARVRTALESIAQKDADEMVRIAARREVYGMAQWRNDVMAVLDNSALPFESRLEPLRGGSSMPSTTRSEDLQLLLQDRQVLLRLVQLVRENLGDPEHGRATFETLVLLSNAKDPVVTELFAEARRKGIEMPFGSGAITLVDGVVTGGSQSADAQLVPSNLLERMREVTSQGAKPAGQ